MCWHRWSDWAIVEKGVVRDMFRDRVGTYMVQNRYCLKCGKHEVDQQILAPSRWDHLVSDADFTRKPVKDIA